MFYYSVLMCTESLDYIYWEGICREVHQKMLNWWEVGDRGSYSFHFFSEKWGLECGYYLGREVAGQPPSL